MKFRVESSLEKSTSLKLGFAVRGQTSITSILGRQDAAFGISRRQKAWGSKLL
jgi:hypothetical protein